MKKLSFFTSPALLAAILTFNFLTLQTFNCPAQNVGINTTGAMPNQSALLDISDSGAANHRGLLIPRVSLLSTTDATTISSPATSLLVYNTNASMTGGAVGFYYWNGTTWVAMGSREDTGHYQEIIFIRQL